MSPREQLLVAVLSSREAKGPVIVLRADTDQETAQRMKVGGRFPRMRLAQGSNTWEEAQHAISQPLEGHLTIVTSAYHQLRAYLTFLKALQVTQLDRSVRLWNVCAPSDGLYMATEFAKIDAYRAKGHCATYEDGLDYLTWRGR